MSKTSTARPKAKAPLKKIATKPRSKTAAEDDLSVVGKSIPEFTLLSTGREEFKLDFFKGKKIVLYFYPKDNTSGCTLEGRDFAQLYSKFKKLNCEIIGVSRDSARSHHSFKEKCGFPFELISDENETLCRYFNVIQMKSMYGRKFEGVVRSTFVIDEKGQIINEWRKVKVAGHAQQVLEFVASI